MPYATPTHKKGEYSSCITFGPWVYSKTKLPFWKDFTGGITKFSAKEILRKILKVSHFSLRYSLDEKCNKINTSQRVSPEFSYSYRVSLVFSRSESKISNKTLWECIISLVCLPGENPKWKWLTCKILLKVFLVENLSMPPVFKGQVPFFGTICRLHQLW